MRTYIIYRKSLFFKTIAYVLVCMGLGILFLEVFKSPFLTIVDFIAMVIPLFLMPLLLKKFTREMLIELDSDRFRFTILGGTQERDILVSLPGLKSYTIYYPNDKLVSMQFNFRGGKSTEFTFFQKKKDASAADSNEIVESIRKTIIEYNAHVDDKQKISLCPSFYASRIGLYFIVALSVLLTIGILFAASYKEKSLPIAFIFGLLLVFQLMIRRRKDLNFYNSIK